MCLPSGPPATMTCTTRLAKAEVCLGREVNISGVSPQYWDTPDPADSFMRHIHERPLVKLELSS